MEPWRWSYQTPAPEPRPSTPQPWAGFCENVDVDCGNACRRAAGNAYHVRFQPSLDASGEPDWITWGVTRSASLPDPAVWLEYEDGTRVDASVEPVFTTDPPEAYVNELRVSWNEDLRPGASVRVMVDPAVIDAVSEESLATPPEDDSFVASHADTLELVSASPADGATDVAVDTAIELTFSMRLESRTISGGILLVDDDAVTVPSNTVQLTPETVRITPSAPLDPATTYRVLITTGLRGGEAGCPRQVEAEMRVTFTTAS